MPFSRGCDFRSECAYFAEYYSSRTATTTPKDPCSLEHGCPEVRSRDIDQQYTRVRTRPRRSTEISKTEF